MREPSYPIEGRRLLILTGGRLGVFESKTAVSVIRYHPDQVVAVLDETHAGGDLHGLVGVGGGIPIVAAVADALPLRPNQLLVGVAPVGGSLEPAWRRHILDALRAGLDLAAGLHLALGRDPEFADAADASGARIYDLREPPQALPIGSGRAAVAPARRILTVGSDCNVGKMVASLELTRALQTRGRDAAFVATGQTGIMIEGSGIAVDRVVCDFLAGAAELLVLERQDREILVIEGQGALTNPAYSGVTLGLIHGTCPEAMILCHHAARTRDLHFGTPIRPLEELAGIYEHAAALLHPARVIGVALNTVGLDDDEARAAVEEAARRTGLPATDVVRFGPDRLADAVERFLASPPEPKRD
jgi:uncharacterized NAD-dependent epimerase/dehydratase family protein